MLSWATQSGGCGAQEADAQEVGIEVVKASMFVEMMASALSLLGLCVRSVSSASHPRGPAEARAVTGLLSCESANWMVFVAVAFFAYPSYKKKTQSHRDATETGS